MARNRFRDNLVSWHVAEYGEPDAHAKGQPWAHIGALTPEQALEINTFQATERAVSRFLGLLDMSPDISTDSQQAAALLGAALPFARRRQGHDCEVLSEESLKMLIALTSIDPEMQIARLQELGFELQVAIKGINLYDLIAYPSPDQALAAVLPTALGKLQ